MMQQLIQAGELILLVVLAVIQLGRWSQKTEDGPSSALQTAKDALKKAEDVGYELRKHKHAWQDFRAGYYTELDKTYARKREVELELIAIKDKQEADCDRITANEEKLNKLTGV